MMRHFLVVVGIVVGTNRLRTCGSADLTTVRYGNKFNMAPVLGYWSLRGLGEPIRTLLAYTGAKYEEKQYHIGAPPTFQCEEWKTDKATLPVDPPNLPYYIDGDIKMSESGAIMRHLARKFGLDGSTEQEKIRIDVAAGVLNDLFRAIVQLVFSPEYEDKKKPFDEGLDGSLGKCEKILSGNFIAGDKISFVDFTFLEQLERYELLVPGCLKKYPQLENYLQRMLALPAIAAYKKTDGYQKVLKTRFFGRMCKIGSGEETY